MLHLGKPLGFDLAAGLWARKVRCSLKLSAFWKWHLVECDLILCFVLFCFSPPPPCPHFGFLVGIIDLLIAVSWKCLGNYLFYPFFKKTFSSPWWERVGSPGMKFKSRSSKTWVNINFLSSAVFKHIFRPGNVPHIHFYCRLHRSCTAWWYRFTNHRFDVTYGTWYFFL